MIFGIARLRWNCFDLGFVLRNWVLGEIAMFSLLSFDALYLFNAISLLVFLLSVSAGRVVLQYVQKTPRIC
jgi:hypothetical protein